MKKSYILISIVTLVMLGAVIYGFSQSGSPFETRRRKMDSQRLSHFSSLRSAIQTYYTTNQKLPDALSALPAKYSFDVKNVKDPESKTEYEYKVTGITSYELCAVFSTDPPKNEEGNAYRYDYYYYDYSGVAPSSTYKRGHSCLPYTVIGSTANPYSYPTTYPNSQFAQARDTQRQSNIRAILDAIGQYQADHSGNFNCPAGKSLPTTSTFIGSSGFNIHDCIVPTYISQLPRDPSAGTYISTSSYATGYRILYDTATRRVTVDAPYAELTKPLSITR